MDRDPGHFEHRNEGQLSFDEMSDSEFDAWLSSLPPAPGIKHVDEDDDADEDFDDIEAAIADGRAFPHEVVAAWLKTWGQPEQKPFKDWLADQNG